MRAAPMDRPRLQRARSIGQLRQQEFAERNRRNLLLLQAKQAESLNTVAEESRQSIRLSVVDDEQRDRALQQLREAGGQEDAADSWLLVRVEHASQLINKNVNGVCNPYYRLVLDAEVVE
ncbi:MAG: hypothetical protein AAFU61_18140, partial [Pseudomonadota bacterium]